MTTEKIRQYVSDLLTVSGFRPDGDDTRLWELLYSLYVAVALFELCTPDERRIVGDTQRKLKYFFVTDCKLKERKRKKTEKENTSPTPLSKEKENKKEIEKKTSVCAERDFSGCLGTRRNVFARQIQAYEGKYDYNRLADFFNYWSEESRHAGKMRFEVQRFWNLEKRLARWMQNQYTAEIEGASIRLAKTRKRQEAEAQGVEKRQMVSAIRQAEDDRRAKELAEARAGSVSLEEYVKRNPNSALKRFLKQDERTPKP